MDGKHSPKSPFSKCRTLGACNIGSVVAQSWRLLRLLIRQVIRGGLASHALPSIFVHLAVGSRFFVSRDRETE